MLNRVFASTNESELFWKERIQKDLLEQFPESLSGFETQADFPLKRIALDFKIRNSMIPVTAVRIEHIFEEFERTILTGSLGDKFDCIFQFHITDDETQKKHSWIVALPQNEPGTYL